MCDDDDLLSPEEAQALHEKYERERAEHNAKYAEEREFNESVNNHDFAPPIDLIRIPQYMEMPTMAGALPYPETPPPVHVCQVCHWTHEELGAKGLSPIPFGPCNPEGALKRKLLRKRAQKEALGKIFGK